MAYVEQYLFTVDNDFGRVAHVYLNGVDVVNRCTMANTRDGAVELFAAGYPEDENGDTIKEHLRGDVQVVLKDGEEHYFVEEQLLIEG